MSEIRIKTKGHINTHSSVAKHDDGTHTLRIEVTDDQGEHVFEVTSENVRDMVWAIAHTGFRTGCFKKKDI